MALETLFSGSIIINRPILEVFEYATDVEKLKDWFPFYATINKVPGQLESRVSFRANFLLKIGPPITIDQIDYVPGRRASYRCISLGLTTGIEFTPSSRGTILESVVSLWGWQVMAFGLAAQPFRPIGNELVSNILMSLKRMVEARAVQVQPRIFFCYRRDQAKYVGGRIYDALCQEFGAGYVFRDFDSITGGARVQQRIQDALASCRMIIAHIDDEWENEIKSRLDENKRDFVREELQSALDHEITLIPVFTSSKENFSMRLRMEKVRETLPDGPIKDALHDRQGLLLRTDPDFNQDIEKLLQTVWSGVELDTNLR